MNYNYTDSLFVCQIKVKYQLQNIPMKGQDKQHFLMFSIYFHFLYSMVLRLLN